MIDADGSGTLHITELVQAGFGVWKSGMTGHFAPAGNAKTKRSR